MMRLGLFLLLLLGPVSVQAQELFELGRTIRSLGMGGMYIPIVTGTDAVFYNPAALGRNNGLNVQLLNLEAGVNGQEALDLINAGSAITSPTSYNQFFGKKIWFEAEGRAGISLPHFGLGFLSETHISLELHNPGFPQFQTYFLNDNVLALGGALTIGPNAYLGMTLKRVQRWGGETIDLGLTTIANANTLSNIGDSFQNKGTGYGVDLALMKEFDGPFNPNLAVVWQDVGVTSFVKTSGAAAPPSINQNVSFGAGGGVDLPGLDWTFGLEARHLLEPEVQLGKKIHFGTEISLPIIDLRAGLGQGYMSYGLGANFLIFRLDAASYTEEMGVYPGQTGQNRILVGLSIDLSFDANFHFVDNNGKKRKLKQRR